MFSVNSVISVFCYLQPIVLSGRQAYLSYEGSGHKFWADFSEKTLKGNIGGEFTAKITGNTFATDNSSKPFSPDMLEVEGGFYGPAAAEIAGVYYDHEHSAGTFGAKKVQATTAPTVQP